MNDLRPAFGSTVANRHWIAGSSVSLQLPAASGGDATVSHALTGPGGATTLTLPQGLSWSAATRTISGTPAGVAAAASWSWTATDGDGDTAQLSFDITVAAANAPRPTSLALSAPVGFDGDYAAGEVIRAVVSFDRNVTVTGAPRLALDIGGVMRQAAWASGSSDADELSFHYTVTSSDFDGDGLAIGPDALTLNGGGIVDAGDSSVAASLGLAGLAIGGPSGRTVRDTRPVFSQAASAADRSLVKDVQTSTTLPRATGGDGALTYSISPALPAGLTLANVRPTVAATLTVQDATTRARPTIAGTPTVEGATTHTLTVTDADGDRATLGPFTVTVAVMPGVSGVSIASSPASGSGYAAGENIDVAVAFSRAVTVTGSPRLALTVGSRTRQAAFRSVSGSTVNFRYTTVGGDRDSDGVSIAADALTLNGGGIGAGGVDAALGLGSHALGNQSGHRVDGGGPTFNGVASPALSFTRGSQGSSTLPAAILSTSDTTYRLAATPALPDGLTFDAATRTLSGAPEAGMATTAYTLVADHSNVLTDSLTFTVTVAGTVPAVSGVSIASSPADGFSYATGEWIEVDVTFNYPVTVTGSPQLALGIGAAARQAERVPGSSDGARQRFRYLVTASDVDRDGVDIAAGALTLNGGGIETSNVAVALGLGGHAIATAADHTVNDPRPAFGATVASRHWIAGSSVSLQLPAASGGDATVSHALTGPAGAPTTLTLPQGLSWTAATRTISGAPGGVAAAASYRWTATDGDGDTAQLSFDITVAAANAPRPTSLALSAPTGFDGDYAAGEVIRAIVAFDRNIAVTGAPQLALDIGGVMRQAAYASGSSDADELSFHYTVTSSDFDGDGLDIGSDALTLNGGGIVDAGDSSVAASLGLAGLAIGGPSGRTVRDTRPVFSQAASAANRSLARDAATSTTLPRATGGDGALTYSVSPALPAGLTLASARPTIAGTPTAAGATTHTLTVTDVDGDRATLGPFTVTVVDGAPGVSAVTIATTPYANATYGQGEAIRIVVDFDKPVMRVGMLLGQATLEVDMGGTIQRWPYSARHTGEGLLFERTVGATDRDADGISVGSDALSLGTGTLTDRETGVAAVTVIGTHAVANAAAHKVDGSASTPLAVHSVSIVSSPASSDGYDVGEEIAVKVAFSRRVLITQRPQLALTIGSNTRQATYARRALDHSPVFTYTVTANDRDSNGIGIAADALTLNGGTITDTLAYPAALDLGTRAIADASAHKVYTPARITGASFVSSPGANGTYDAGETVTVELSWSQTVSIDGGTPRVALTIGSNTRQAARDTAAAALGHPYRYSYTVTASDWDGDGIGVGADALTLPGGFRMTGNGGVDAVLSLGTHAIADDSGHTVRDSKPVLTVAARPYLLDVAVSDALTAAGGDAPVTYTFTGPGTATTLSLPAGLSWNAATQTISGTPTSATAAASYTLTATDTDGDAATATFDLSVVSDPVVTGVAITSSPASGDVYAPGEAITADVTFDRALTVTGAPQLAIAIGSATRQAAGSHAAGESKIAFSYTVTTADRDADGVAIAAGALALNGATIRNARGENARLDLGSHALAAQAGHKVSAPPRVVDVIVRTPDLRAGVTARIPSWC